MYLFQQNFSSRTVIAKFVTLSELPDSFFLRCISRIARVFSGCVKVSLHISYFFVQFMQVDVRENGRQNATLRSAAVCSVILPVVHKTRIQEFSDEV